LSSSENPGRQKVLTSPHPLIYCVTNLIGGASRQAPDAFLQLLLHSGVDLIQLREKAASDHLAFSWLQSLLRARKRGGPGILINTRMDMAAAAGADGIHLSSAAIPVSRVRDCLGSGFLIGKSVHSLQEAVRSCEDGVDYLFFGPIFETPSKAQWGAPQGLMKLREVCRSVPLPVFGIGGIHPGNASAVIEQGACGIAAIGWFQKDDDPAARVRELARALGRIPA
jgi:thiamine-phosphate pyrophosphorylase